MVLQALSAIELQLHGGGDFVKDESSCCPMRFPWETLTILQTNENRMPAAVNLARIVSAARWIIRLCISANTSPFYLLSNIYSCSVASSFPGFPTLCSALFYTIPLPWAPCSSVSNPVTPEAKVWISKENTIPSTPSLSPFGSFSTSYPVAPPSSRWFYGTNVLPSDRIKHAIELSEGDVGSLLEPDSTRWP